MEKSIFFYYADNHISVGGFTHRLGVCSAPVKPEKGIYNNEGYTLFTHNAAVDFAKTQTGYKMYSSEEMEALMEAIPGKTKGNQVQIILELSQIPLAGSGNPGGNVEPVGEEAFLWSSSCREERADCCCLNRGNRVSGFSRNSVEYAFSLVLRKDN